jgi:hypothetical protein
MFDMHGCGTAAAPTHAIEFLRVQLSPAADGSIFVALTATSVDDTNDCPELVDQEIASERASGIDAAIAVIAEHARRALQRH